MSRHETAAVSQTPSVSSQADVCSVTKSNHGASIDFTDARALRALTATLLRHDFDLDIELRDDRLCPTVGTSSQLTLTRRLLTDSTTS